MVIFLFLCLSFFSHYLKCESNDLFCPSILSNSVRNYIIVSNLYSIHVQYSSVCDCTFYCEDIFVSENIPNDQMCNWSQDASDTFLCFLRNSFSLFVACSFFHFLFCERIDTSIQIQSKLCKTELCIQFYNCKSFQQPLKIKFLNKVKNQITGKRTELRNK